MYVEGALCDKLIQQIAEILGYPWKLKQHQHIDQQLSRTQAAANTHSHTTEQFQWHQDPS